MKRASIITASVIIASSLVISPLNIPLVSAADTKQAAVSKTTSMKPFSGAAFKTFMITKKSYIQIKDIYFQYGSKEKQVYFTLTVHNGDNTTIDFMDYWTELLTSSGAKYPVKSYAGNSKSGKVTPNTSKDFTFYSQIDSKLNYTDLTFRIVKWDFSLPNYTKTIGQAKVTSNYKNSVPENAYYINNNDNNKIKTYLNAGTIFEIGTQKQIHIDLNMENIGLYEYNLPSYQFYIKTKAGLVLKLSTQAVENQTLAAGESIKYSLRSSIKKSVDLAGAQILMMALDAESKLEVPKSIYSISWAQKNNFITAENKEAKLMVNDSNINASIVNVYADQSSSQNEVTLTTRWLNKGSEAIILPKYKQEILASNGVRYPVTLSEADGDIQLIPGVEKEIIVQATLPSTLNQDLTLLIKQPKDEKNPLEYVSAAFKIPKIQAIAGVSTKTYKSDKGIFEVKIKQAERLPWGNQDIINVFIDIQNKGLKAQSIPQISAILRLNGLLINDDKIKLLKLDSAGILEPTSSTRYVLTTKVPYTNKINEISINLTDKINDKNKQTIGLFKLAQINSIPEVNTSNKLNFESVGRRASVEFMNTYMFKGVDKDIIYAEFKYTNNESRYNKLPVLKAYFKTSDGQYIDANMPNIKANMKPNGSTIITAMAQVPKTFIHDGSVQLVIGEALSAGEYTAPDGTADSFISAKSFKLPKMQNNTQDGVTNLKIEPYTFSLNKLNTMLNDVTNIKLEIDYSLSKTAVYDLVEKETKLYFEITDGKNAYGSSVKIEPSEGEGLAVGEEKKIIIPITGNQLGNLVYNGYALNVYEEVDGYKRLLGTKKYGSFQIAQLP